MLRLLNKSFSISKNSLLLNSIPKYNFAKYTETRYSKDHEWISILEEQPVSGKGILNF